VGLDADLQTRVVRMLSEVESVVQPQASRGKR